MRRLAFSPLNMIVVLLLAAVVPPQAFAPPPMQTGGQKPGEPVRLPVDLFKVPDGLEVTVWATSPLLHNPTNIDIDRDGRIWVAEGVRYRSHHARQPEGDRIVVLQDKNGDGKADSDAHVRAGARAHRTARRFRDRQQDRRRPAARPHCLYGRRSQSAVRSSRGQARGAAHGLSRHQPRPLAPLGDRRPRRQMDIQRRQHGRGVHRSIGEDVPNLWVLPSQCRGCSVQVSARSRRICGKAQRRRPRVRGWVHRSHEP